MWTALWTALPIYKATYITFEQQILLGLVNKLNLLSVDLCLLIVQVKYVITLHYKFF